MVRVCVLMKHTHVPCQGRRREFESHLPLYKNPGSKESGFSFEHGQCLNSEGLTPQPISFVPPECSNDSKSSKIVQDVKASGHAQSRTSDSGNSGLHSLPAARGRLPLPAAPSEESFGRLNSAICRPPLRWTTSRSIRDWGVGSESSLTVFFRSFRDAP